jgi:hypothetical protein
MSDGLCIQVTNPQGDEETGLWRLVVLDYLCHLPSAEIYQPLYVHSAAEWCLPQNGDDMTFTAAGPESESPIESN